MAKASKKNAKRCEEELPVKTPIPASMTIVAVSLQISVVKISALIGARANGNKNPSG